MNHRLPWRTVGTSRPCDRKLVLLDRLFLREGAKKGDLHFARQCIIFAQESRRALNGALFTCPKSRFTTWATVKTVAQVVISIAQVVISIAQVVLPAAQRPRRALKIHKLFTPKITDDRKLVRTT